MKEPSNSLNKPQALSSLITYQTVAIVSKELIKTPTLTITLFAFDKNQGLSEHSTPYVALLQAIDGTAQITIDKTLHTIKEGEIITLPANIPHALQATANFKMLLTMIKDD